MHYPKQYKFQGSQIIGTIKITGDRESSFNDGSIHNDFLIIWLCIFPSLVYKCVSIKDKVDIRNNTHLPPHTHTHTHTHCIRWQLIYKYLCVCIYIFQSENRVSNESFHSTASPSHMPYDCGKRYCT